jgi:NAD(P)-dependent dehydrogenase (short-subunit alcohol dehydrogenase family)
MVEGGVTCEKRLQFALVYSILHYAKNHEKSNTYESTRIDPSYRARAQKAIPLGYMQPPATVAHAFLFLCSHLADYMTGSVLRVDGGCSLYPMD